MILIIYNDKNHHNDNTQKNSYNHLPQCSLFLPVVYPMDLTHEGDSNGAPKPLVIVVSLCIEIPFPALKDHRNVDEDGFSPMDASTKEK